MVYSPLVRPYGCAIALEREMIRPSLQFYGPHVLDPDLYPTPDLETRLKPRSFPKGADRDDRAWEADKEAHQRTKELNRKRQRLLGLPSCRWPSSRAKGQFPEAAH
jgi:hypothetical protein